MTPRPPKEDRLLTMKEVKDRLRLSSQAGLYRLIREDKDFITFKTGEGLNSPRLMRESALERWIQKREVRERPELTGARK